MPHVAACLRTPVRLPSAPPHCRRNPRPAVCPLGALRESRNVGAHGYFGKLVSCLPFCRYGRICAAVASGFPTRARERKFIPRPRARYKFFVSERAKASDMALDVRANLIKKKREKSLPFSNLEHKTVIKSK